MALHRVSAPLTLHVPYVVAFDAVMTALPWLSMKVGKCDPSAGIVIAKTRMTALTWGERILVDVWAIDPAKTGMKVESTVVYGLLDLGRNAKNIDRVIDAVHRAMSTGPSPA